MNEMRKLMEAVELNEGAVDATAYLIYSPNSGYYQKPGYYTDNLALAKFYSMQRNAERQANSTHYGGGRVLPKNVEIWEVKISEVRQVK